MINVLSLQNELTDNFDALKKILVRIGCNEENIRLNRQKHLISSTRPDPEADNPNGLLIYSDSLQYMFTTRSGRGNIFTLVMEHKNVNFPKALELIGEWIGAKLQNIDIHYPFGGFYRNIVRQYTEPEQYLTPYKETDLPPPDSLSELFLKDGISLQIQEQWGVRFDQLENNVLIPIRDYNGRLVGCKARNNDKDCDHHFRWFAYLPYSKTAVVYGFYENYAEIQKKQTVVVFESEKSVLQCASFDCGVAVAVGGHNISPIQARYIKSLMASKVIIAFDADISEEELQFEAGKLKSESGILDNSVGYIYDGDHEYLGENDSPSDLGREVFRNLMKHKTKWIGGSDGTEREAS